MLIPDASVSGARTALLSVPILSACCHNHTGDPSATTHRSSPAGAVDSAAAGPSAIEPSASHPAAVVPFFDYPATAATVDPSAVDTAVDHTSG